MSKFKIGDKVKYYDSFFGLTRYGIVIPYPNPTMRHHTEPQNVWAYWVDDVSLICTIGKGTPTYIREKNVEFITTTFEVGKKYVPAASKARGIITILAELDDGDWAFSFEDFNTGSISVNKLHPSSFPHYKEYIPPPPEEWRIVYKDKCGEITVGVHPFISDSEARSSNFWNSKAYKTIRIDE